jgi:hypothetical protein
MMVLISNLHFLGFVLQVVDILSNSVMFFSGFVLQGVDVLPTSPSGRFMVFTWWLFVMILTSMYTANLTAHLTLERSNNRISELGDLLRQNEYSWGLISDRNLESMMKNHGDKKYQSLVERAVKLSNLDDGIRRVNEGKFVLIDDSSVITYNLRNNCHAIQTYTGTFQNQWALGMQMNSPYASIINNLMLKYRESGFIVRKFDKWYNDGNELYCSSTFGNDVKFDISILSGLFLILAFGALIAFFIMFLEYLYAANKDRLENGRTFFSALKERMHSKGERNASGSL